MPIEKEFKTLLEIKKMNSEEKTTRRIQIQNWLRNHRLNSRKKLRLNFNHVPFSKFVTFIPLALGFSQFLTHRLFVRPNESFFEKNLPFFQTFQPKITLETVDYIAKPNYFASVGAGDKKKVESTFEFVEFISQNENLGKFGQPHFLAKIKKRSLSPETSRPEAQPNEGSELLCFSENNERFTALSCDFYILPSGNFLSNFSSRQKVSKNLDELPSYLKGLNQDYTLRDPLTLFSTSQTGEKTQTKSKAKLLMQPAPATCFTKLNLVKTTEALAQPSFLNSNVKSSSPNLLQDCSRNCFYKNRVDFYDKVKQLNTELDNLFIEKNISSFPLDTLESDSKRFQFLEDIRIAEKILADFEKNQISKESPGFRPMSGYLYPDMTSDEIESFYNSKNQFAFKSGSVFKEKRKLTLESMGFPIFPQTYSFSLIKLPKILLETKNILLKTGENKEVLYNGPSVVLDSKKTFDWKNSYDQQLRSWFHHYLSPINPLFQSRKNFFGNYFSPQFGVDGKLESFSDFRTHSFFKLKLTKTLETNWNSYEWIYNIDSVQSLLVPANSSFHIPFEKEKQNSLADKSNLRGLFLNLSKNENEDFLPLVQINQPVFTHFSNHGYSPVFEFGRKGNPDYKSSPLLIKLGFGSGLIEDSFITKYTSGQYKKLSSFYTKKTYSNSIYVDNWEPLTSNSWLVVSQLSFAIFCFHILKNLADNYGRELLGYLLDLVAALGILDDSLKQQIEILTGQRNKGFRVVLQSKKKFHDIVGIQKLLLEIYEVVLFLRNSARDFILSKTLPHGILLIGPPGTGKTLLVQALAGEAQVPVIVLSGSSLIEPGESSSFKLQMVFQEARQLAPCIVFIDEIDTLSAKRNQLVQNPMATDEGFESFLESLILESKISFQKTLNQSRVNLVGSVDEIDVNEKQAQNSSSSNSEQTEKQLSLLSQLLIELDGIQSREGVVVIGATNRPEVLDPALLRPGRFDKILKVNLPEHKKRVEILQFYGKNLGYQQTIPWNYLGERTAGFTAADLATLMNESTIKAILNQSSHTIETIEHGIDRLTTSESEKYTVLKFNQKNQEIQDVQNLSISSKLSIIRLAYYQAGKIILSYALQAHPKTIVASLWPRRPTIRSMQITTNLQNSLFEFARLGELNDRLIGCYAGKAAEFLFLEKFSGKFLSQTSTLGLDDLLFAQKLVYFMLEDCRFYSKKTHTQKTITLLPNINKREFYKNLEKLDMYTKMVDRIQTPPMWEAIEAETSSIRAKKETQNQAFDLQEQRRYSVPWWQLEVSDELEFKPKNPGNGSRLYLYNSERTDRNPEWLPPDEFYHTSSGLKNTKKAVIALQKWKKRNHGILELSSEKTLSSQVDLENLKNLRKVYFPWNDISKITRDYSAHSLVLQSFNKALLILNENRELLDRLVIELLYQELLRKPEIESLIKDFELRNKIPSVGKNMFIKKEFSQKNAESFTETFSEKENLVKIIENSWGANSRKKAPNWIDFAALKK